MKAKDVKREGGKLIYHGQEFDGFNKPKNAPAGAKQKKVVLAKKGDARALWSTWNGRLYPAQRPRAQEELPCEVSGDQEQKRSAHQG
jgi:hypothetical protein